MTPTERQQFSKSIIGEWRKAIRLCDNPAQQGPVRTESQGEIIDNRIKAQSLNDILDRRESSGSLANPRLRARLLKISSILNSPEWNGKTPL